VLGYATPDVQVSQRHHILAAGLVGDRHHVICMPPHVNPAAPHRGLIEQAREEEAHGRPIPHRADDDRPDVPVSQVVQELTPQS
jgi:hypothetical protein